MSNAIFTYDLKKKCKVKAGYYNPDYRTFIKICLPEHFMILEQGYGISEDVIQKLERRGCDKVLIHTKTQKLISNFEEWKKRIPKDYGSGLQRFLPTEMMRRIQ